MPRLLLLSAVALAVLLLLVVPATAVPHRRFSRFRMQARGDSSVLAPASTPAMVASAQNDALLAGFATPIADASSDALRAIADLRLRMARGVDSAAPIATTTTTAEDEEAEAEEEADATASSSTGTTLTTGVVSSVMHEDDVQRQQRASWSGLNVTVAANTTVPQNISLFFPAECSVSERTCCPLYLGLVCGGASRGSCQLIAQSATCVLDSWISDVFDYGCVCEGNRDGIACESCVAGYAGANCTEVTATVMRRNFASLTLSGQQAVIDAFLLAKVTPHPFHPGISAYDWLVAYHQWAQASYKPWTSELNSKLAFWQGPGAPTWHRQYQLLVDHTFRLVTGDDKFTMPYWNWAISSGTNQDLTLAAFGGDGDPVSGFVDRSSGEWYRCRAVVSSSITEPLGCNCTVTRGPFVDWRVLGAWGEPIEGGTRPLTRSFACMEPSLPTLDVVVGVTALTRYSYFEANGGQLDGPNVTTSADSFLPLMVGIGHAPSHSSTWPPSLMGNDMNSRVNRWVGGTMMSDSAASDPLFFLHLAFADGIFESWIRKQIDAETFSVEDNGLPSDGEATGQNANDCVAPHYPLHAHRDYFQSTLALGYDYDFLELEAEDATVDQWWN